jgi:hypothetical protein
MMGVKTGILGGNDGVSQNLGDLVEGNEDPPLDVELRDLFVVVVEDLAALDGIDALESSHRGQGARENGERPDGRGAGSNHPTSEEESERYREPAEN